MSAVDVKSVLVLTRAELATLRDSLNVAAQNASRAQCVAGQIALKRIRSLQVKVRTLLDGVRP